MSKAIPALLIQSIITFFIGLFLATNGLPSSPEEAAINLGTTLLNDTANTVNQPVAKEVAYNGIEGLRNLGIGISIISALEFLGLILSLFKR